MFVKFFFLKAVTQFLNSYTTSFSRLPLLITLLVVETLVGLSALLKKNALPSFVKLKI